MKDLTVNQARHWLSAIDHDRDGGRAMDALYGCACGYVCRGDRGIKDHIAREMDALTDDQSRQEGVNE